MNKPEKLAKLSEALGFALPEEMTVPQLDALISIVDANAQAVEEKAALEAKLTNAEAASQELLKQLSELNQKLVSAESETKTTGKKNVVKVGKDSYYVVGPVRFNNKVHTVAEIIADKELAKSLTEKGSGMLRKI